MHREQYHDEVEENIEPSVCVYQGFEVDASPFHLPGDLKPDIVDLHDWDQPGKDAREMQMPKLTDRIALKRQSNCPSNQKGGKSSR